MARGQYLVAITACNDCHTPFKMGANGPEPDMARLLSGHPEGMEPPPPPAASGPWIWTGTDTGTAFAGPWGISYSANLTPDEATGMGIWTEEMFVKAMRTGRHFGQSRPILPPMPWPWIAKMTDDDLKAVYAYLRSIPPVVNHVPDPAPPAGAGGARASPVGPFQRSAAGGDSGGRLAARRESSRFRPSPGSALALLVADGYAGDSDFAFWHPLGSSAGAVHAPQVIAPEPPKAILPSMHRRRLVPFLSALAAIAALSGFWVAKLATRHGGERESLAEIAAALGAPRPAEARLVLLPELRSSAESDSRSSGDPRRPRGCRTRE